MQAAQTSPPTVLHPQGGDQPAAPVTDQTLVPAKFRVTRETPEHRCVGDPSPQRERGVQGRTTPSKSRPRTRSPCKHCWHRRRAHPTRGKSPSPDSSNQERQPSPRPEEGQGHQLRAPPAPNVAVCRGTPSQELRQQDWSVNRTAIPGQKQLNKLYRVTSVKR